MSAMKQWATSADGQAEAQHLVDLAQARFDHVCLAAALAAPHVDAATLDHLTYVASHELGTAYEVLAMACGYETAGDLYR